MLKALFGSVFTSSLLWVGLAAAQAPSAKSNSAQSAAAGSVAKAPLGTNGLSPFRVAVNKGDRALLARDFQLAIVAYQEAIAKEPTNPLGQYRLGAAQIAKGDLHEAEGAFLTGLRLASAADSAVKAKLLFALADLRERQKAWDDASAKWTDYDSFTAQQKVGFPGSGSERKRTLELWKKVSADSAEVKARIDKGSAAADEAIRKSSK